MKIGFLSDVHGNIYALEKCLSYLQRIPVDRIYFLGDAVGYYPDCVDVLKRLIKDNIHCLLGNHEAMLLGNLAYKEVNEKVYQFERIRNEVPAEILDFIQKLSPHYEFNIDGRRIKLIHGGPSNFLTQYIYPENNLDEFANKPFDFYFMGHTHYPFIKEIKGTKVVNVGSCGMPRDYGIFSSFALLNTENWEVEIMRIQMDEDVLLEKFRYFIHESVFELYKRKPDFYIGKLVE
jgi:putative phosphoesterase